MKDITNREKIMVTGGAGFFEDTIYFINDNKKMLTILG